METCPMNVEPFAQRSIPVAITFKGSHPSFPRTSIDPWLDLIHMNLNVQLDLRRAISCAPATPLDTAFFTSQPQLFK